MFWLVQAAAPFRQSIGLFVCSNAAVRRQPLQDQVCFGAQSSKLPSDLEKLSLFPDLQALQKGSAVCQKDCVGRVGLGTLAASSMAQASALKLVDSLPVRMELDA